MQIEMIKAANLEKSENGDDYYNYPEDRFEGFWDWDNGEDTLDAPNDYADDD